MATPSRIQEGTITIGIAETTATATVATYDAASTILLFTGDGGTFTADRCQVVGRKASSTTVTFTRADSGEIGLSIRFKLIEFDSGVSVQDVDFVGASETATISTVNESQSFVVPSGSANTGTNRGSDDSGRAVISGPTSLQYVLDAGDQDATFQVVDFDGCSIQEVTQLGGTSAASFSDTISAVDESATALFCSSEWNGNGTMGNNDLMWIELSSPTTVDGSRIDSGYPITISYYVVEFSDGPTIERGTGSITGTDTSTNIPVSSGSPDNRSVYFPNASNYPYLNAGDDNSDAYQEVNLLATFSSDTQLTLSRSGGSLDGLVNFSWEVHNWFAGAADSTVFFAANT